MGESGSRGMGKLAFGSVVTITAVVTAVLTSLFWIAAYSIALPSDGTSSAPPRPQGGTAPPAPVDLRPAGSRPDAIVAPSGLVVPVAGIRPDQLVDTFTQSRAGGRPHNAIDIMAPAGTAVVSVAEGTVEKLYFSEGGGGISAYVRSPDRNWIFYYAHLQAYAPGLREGQRLRGGDLVGTVGSTGNANPAGPHLHFAIYRMAPGQSWHEGTPINPHPLLAGRPRQ